MSSIYKTESGKRALIARYRELLTLWPVPAEHLILPTSQGDTFVIASGARTSSPLVLLHGANSNSSVWMHDVAIWSKEFHVFAIDLIGDAGLSAPSRPSLKSGLYASWLSEVFDGLSLKQASLVGKSLGGWIALDFATQNPLRVEKLVLLSPCGVGRQKFRYVILAAFLMMLGDWGRCKTIAIAQGAHAKNTLAGGPEASTFLLSIMKEFRSREVLLPRFGDMKLRQLAMPVLLIVGGRDVIVDAKSTHARMKRAVPKLTTRFLPEAGHLIVGQTAEILKILRCTA
jgi:pimeloyl-ACP methyl ester carboxylesterase